MKNNQLFKRSIHLLLIILFIFSACQEDEVTPDNDQQENIENLDNLTLKTVNVLVFHEGNFGASNSTIGSYNPESLEYNPTAYRDENNKFIGDVQQSVIHNDGLYYSVLNGSNKVSILDSVSLTDHATIENEIIVVPRDLTIAGETGYLSTWGPYGESSPLIDSRIVLLDLAQNTVSGSIETGEGLEDVHIIDNTLLVTRNWWDGTYQHLTFINTESNEIIADIDMPAGPQEILEDASGNIWIVCSSGALVKIDVAEASIANTVDLGGTIFADADIYEDAIYFLQDNEIKAYDINSGNISSITTAMDIAAIYGFGVDPISGDIYLGDAVDYSDGGKVLRYSTEGELLDEFNSGISPSQFIFETKFVSEEQ